MREALLDWVALLMSWRAHPRVLATHTPGAAVAAVSSLDTAGIALAAEEMVALPLCRSLCWAHKATVDQSVGSRGRQGKMEAAGTRLWPMARVEGAQSPIHTPMLHSPTMPVRQVDHSPIRSLDGRWDASTAQTRAAFRVTKLPAMTESQNSRASSVHSPVHHSVEASMEATVEVRSARHRTRRRRWQCDGNSLWRACILFSHVGHDGNTDGQHRGDGDNGGGGDGSESGLSCARPISYGARMPEDLALCRRYSFDSTRNSVGSHKRPMSDRAFVTFGRGGGSHVRLGVPPPPSAALAAVVQQLDGTTTRFASLERQGRATSSG